MKWSGTSSARNLAPLQVILTFYFFVIALFLTLVTFSVSLFPSLFLSFSISFLFFLFLKYHCTLLPVHFPSTRLFFPANLSHPLPLECKEAHHYLLLEGASNRTETEAIVCRCKGSSALSRPRIYHFEAPPRVPPLPPRESDRSISLDRMYTSLSNPLALARPPLSAPTICRQRSSGTALPPASQLSS